MLTLKRVLLVALTFLVATPAFAHREDFIGETLVFLTLERQELEPEVFVDTWRGYREYHAAVEYGITDHLMVDSRISWKPGGDSRDGRVEFRYRFGEEGARPVDVALSAEVNAERKGGEAEEAFEPRLILSKDFRRLNLTLNVSREIALRGDAERGFQLANGVRFDATHALRFGNETLYDTRTHGGTLVPQIWLVLPHDAVIRFGYFAGFGGEPRFVRVGVEVEL